MSRQLRATAVVIILFTGSTLATAADNRGAPDYRAKSAKGGEPLPTDAPTSTEESVLLVADSLRVRGELKQAAELLDQGLQVYPSNRKIRLALVRTYRLQGAKGLDAAMKVLDEAEGLAEFKNDPTWPRERAILEMDRRDHEASGRAMRRAIELAPKNLEYRREFIDMELQFHDYDAVIKESDRLLAEGHDTWWVRHQRGLAFAKRKDADKARAVKEFDAAAALADAAGDAATAEFTLRGMAAAVGYDEVIERVKPRVANDPTGRWELLLASFYSGKGDSANAVKVVDRMLADPANAAPRRRVPVLRAAADIYGHEPKVNHAKVAKMYEEIIELVPDDLPALNNLAYLLVEEMHQPKAAKRYSTRAFQVMMASRTPNGLILDTHGWILTLCGGKDAEEGLRILQEVVKEKPDIIEAHYHLGEALLRQNDTTGAAAQFQEAERLLKKAEEADDDPPDASLAEHVRAAIERMKTQEKEP